MGRLNEIKKTIDASIRQNGNQEITGQVLNDVLNGIASAAEVDLSATEQSARQFTESYVEEYIQEHQPTIVVDKSLSATSENAVSNKAVTTKFNEVTTQQQNIKERMDAKDAELTEKFSEINEALETIGTKVNNAATKEDVNTAIASAITSTLNTEV